MMNNLLRTPTKTPTKISRKILLTPTTKNRLCNICGKSIDNVSDRRQLIQKDGTPSKSGDLIKEVIGVNVLLDFNRSNIICRSCHARLDTAKNKTNLLIQQQQATQGLMQQQYSVQVTKRTQPGVNDSPGKENQPLKRRSLFQSTSSSSIETKIVVSELNLFE